MRLFATLIFLTLFILSAGQSGTVKKITLGEALSAAAVNNSSLKSGSQKKALAAEVEKAYFEKVYQMGKFKLLQQQTYLLHDIERVAALRYEAGDIDLLEKTLLISRVAEIRTDMDMLNDDLAITGNKLKHLLHATDDLVPADSVLTMYAIHKGDMAPSVSDSAAWSTRESNKENLEFTLNKYFKKIQYFRQIALGKAEMLIAINRIRYEKEEIDYTDYTQSADEAFRIQMEYLQILNLYNQTAIQLELYAN